MFSSEPVMARAKSKPTKLAEMILADFLGLLKSRKKPATRKIAIIKMMRFLKVVFIGFR